MSTRVATFNCENLFSRSKVLNLSDTPQQVAKAQAALAAFNKLKGLMAQSSYTAADKAEMVALVAEGKGFFTIEVDRGKFMSGNKVVAKGVDDFYAHVRFVTKEVSEAATENTGKVIKALNADVLCTIEVESREMLGDFNSQILKTKKFAHHMVVDGNDPRGIDVGIMSKLPLSSMRSHVDDKDGNSKTFSRDCIEHEVILASGKSLWVICNHFKSKLGPPASSDARRKKQAERVAAILGERFDLTRDLVVVAGDLNDTPASAPLSPLLTLPNLHNLVATLPAADQYTHVFRGDKSQIDYLLVSMPLLNALEEIKIERRGMEKVPGHFPSVTGPADAASDHAGVVAQFSV
ncbi:MAG: endonuclease/exonuclease/phosphatase family protein [Bryobacteraceae bacterium]